MIITVRTRKKSWVLLCFFILFGFFQGCRTAEFSDTVRIKCENEQYIFGTAYITYIWNNDTTTTISVGFLFEVDQLENGEWVPVDMNAKFDKSAREIPAGGTYEVMSPILINDPQNVGYFRFLDDGKYRIRQNYRDSNNATHEVYAEFEIRSNELN